MRSILEIDEGGACIIRFDKDMDATETDELIEALGKLEEKEGKDINKFIGIVPQPDFMLQEYFRTTFAKLIRKARKRDPELRVALVTSQFNIKGYEQFARLMMDMVGKEQVFETLLEAKEWIYGEE